MKNRNFWLYAAGGLFSATGSGAANVVIPLFVLDSTGSGTAMVTFMIIGMVPRLILYPVAGVIGDRINRKQIMVSMDFGRGAVGLLLALLAAQDYITVPILVGAQLVVSTMSVLSGPATIAMLPDIVEKEDLTRANSLLGAIHIPPTVGGAALGGILYGLGGIQVAFLINCILFVASGVSKLFIRYLQKTEKFERVSEVITDLKEGISFIKVHRGLLFLLVFSSVSSFLLAPIFSELVPYFMRITIKFSAEQYSMIQTSLVAGMLIGYIIIAAVLAKARIEKMLKRGLLLEQVLNLAFAVLIFPLIIGILGYRSWTFFSLIFIVFILRGFFNAFVSISITVGLQKLAPTEFRARIFSVLGFISAGITPVGVGIMRILLNRAPIHVIALTLFLLNLLVVLIFILKYLKRVSRDLEHQE